MVETLRNLCEENDIEFNRLMDAIVREFLSDADLIEAVVNGLQAEEDEADYCTNRGVVDGVE